MGLQDAITGVQALVGAVSGIKSAPSYPIEKLGPFPMAVAFAGEGVWEFGAGGDKKGLHSIVVIVPVARKDMKYDAEKVMPFCESVPNAIMADPTLGGNASTFGFISYAFGDMEWAGELLVGFRFVVEQVKITSVIS